MRKASDLVGNDRYHFAGEEMRTALGVSADAVKMSLYRLVKRSVVARPARGFYIIVPREYKWLGSLAAGIVGYRCRERPTYEN